jgi:aspartate/methionine/tyrosine aminotransferase
MPRHPQVNPRIANLRGGVFSRLAHKISALGSDCYPLHVGDTWMEPVEGARMEDLRVKDHPGMHRYSAPQGHPVLLSALEARCAVSRDRLLVTAGATGALSCALGALVQPGDEVLILAPYWPLIPGLVTAAGATPVEVPFYDRLGSDPVAAVAAQISPRTVALYVNSPSNPSGHLLPLPVLRALVELARRHDLWLLSDEVYEDLCWGGEQVALRSLAPERTLSAHSFSKSYGMAGNRCGYLIGPTDPTVMLEVRKVSTHSTYAAATASQLAAVQVLERGGEWLAQARASYQATSRAAAALLGLPAPAGGTFLFLDVADHLDARGLDGFLEDCLDRRLLLAPGASCGRDYSTWVRICTTSAQPERVLQGVELLRDLLGESAARKTALG